MTHPLRSALITALELIIYCGVGVLLSRFNSLQKRSVNCVDPFSVASLVDSKILEKVPARIVCLTKYVDDIFCLVPHDKVTDILSHFNGYHPKLQFTVEMEKEGGLPYLDTYVIRKPSSLATMWYKKPIASDRMLNFHSQHPLRQKVGTAIGFMKRIDKLTTTNRENMKEIAISKLRVNGFPPKLINALWNKHIGQPASATHNISHSSPTNTEVIYKSITYIPKLSDTIKRILCAETQTIKIAFKCAHTNSELYTNLKTKIDPLLESGVVYSIPCECERVYVGKTMQRLKDRMNQHKRSITQYDPNQEEKSDATALVTHARKMKHQFLFDSVEIVDRCEHNKKLEYLEMLHIQIKRSHTVNKRSDTEGINTIYTSLLQRVKTRQQHTNTTIDDEFQSCDES
ncbi:uncharacterized protein LOC129809184 [Phlebotomus papatasi]|uniref:uncharacterized protein LOC129809184 n=1 Tax=Phlebotomus papatasi TaxID=29031 RepID=UPI002483B8BD|nr:uncharacterized protein LOC129809184 [Phlebotomus papatasi]